MGLKNLNLVVVRLLAAAAAALLAVPASVQGQSGAAACTASVITTHQLHPVPQLPDDQQHQRRQRGGADAGVLPVPGAAHEREHRLRVPHPNRERASRRLGVPVNRTLAIALPKACNSAAVPLQCRDTSAQIPAPGPVIANAPSAALPPPATPATQDPEAPGTPISQGQTRPMVLPSSAPRASAGTPAAATFVLLLAVGAAALV
ncbi:unnamed protein product [Urochloa humidicola]